MEAEERRAPSPSRNSDADDNGSNAERGQSSGAGLGTETRTPLLQQPRASPAHAEAAEAEMMAAEAPDRTQVLPVNRAICGTPLLALLRNYTVVPDNKTEEPHVVLPCGKQHHAERQLHWRCCRGQAVAQARRHSARAPLKRLRRKVAAAPHPHQRHLCARSAMNMLLMLSMSLMTGKCKRATFGASELASESPA